MNHKNHALILMILTGVYSPIIFFISEKICGNGCQADSIYIKTFIDFGAGAILLGSDKSYIYHHKNYAKEKNPILINILILVAIFLSSIFYLFSGGSITVFSILIGIIASSILSIFRAITISESNYKKFNFITLAYYISFIASVPLLIKFDASIMFSVGAILSIFWLLFLFRSYNTIQITNLSFITDLKNILYFYKYGVSDYLLGIFISLPALLFTYKFKTFDLESDSYIRNFGLIFLMSTMLRYPVSSLMPLILSKRNHHTKWIGQLGLTKLLFIFIFALPLMLLSFLFAIKEIGFLENYIIVKDNFHYVGIYLWLSLTAYLSQIYLLFSAYKKAIIITNIIANLITLTPYIKVITETHTYIILLITIELIKLTILYKIFTAKRQ